MDFEGRKAEPEMLLGASWQRKKSGPPSLRHYVIDKRLSPIADRIVMDGDDVAEHEWAVTTTRAAITELLGLAKKQDRLIVAWSQHDFKVVAEGRGLSPYQQRHLVPRYRDAKETAKKWVNRGIAGTALPPGKGHTLDRYQQLIGYEVPAAYGIGRTGTNLGELIKALEKRGGWDDLTDRQHQRALEVIGHNYFDLDSMREIVIRAADETATWESERSRVIT
ncbi:MAG: hypothetical protein RIB98_14930 [Acidimicrobiales bacterium]